MDDQNIQCDQVEKDDNGDVLEVNGKVRFRGRFGFFVEKAPLGCYTFCCSCSSHVAFALGRWVYKDDSQLYEVFKPITDKEYRENPATRGIDYRGYRIHDTEEWHQSAEVRGCDHGPLCPSGYPLICALLTSVPQTLL